MSRDSGEKEGASRTNVEATHNVLGSEFPTNNTWKPQTDLVERLRGWDHQSYQADLMNEAADALEQMQGELHRLRAGDKIGRKLLAGRDATIKQISAERDAIAASDLGGALADALARIAELEVHIDDIETASELPHLRERITELEGALRAIAEDAYSHVGVARTIARAALRKEEGRD